MKKSSLTKEIQKKLFELQDLKYKDFSAKLIPGINPDSVIGVRTPALRSLAKELYKKEDCSSFFSDLPHKYFDENQLHAFLIGEIKDYDKCIEELNRFLPYVDNWATCDQMSPKILKKHKKELLENIDVWILSDKTYTVRFAIGMLMEHYLDEDFDKKYLKKVASVRSEEYYINMMIAWYFATALAKQYESTIPYIEKNKLSDWVHQKTIQKAVESNRISDETKIYLKTLRKN